MIHWDGGGERAKIWVQKSAGSSECLSQILPLNFPKPFQLAQLEDDFTSLLEGASTDTQKVFSSEMEQIKNQCLKESASLQEEDDGLVPEDYESDDNKTGDEKETDEEEEVCHITKVCVCHFWFVEGLLKYRRNKEGRLTVISVMKRLLSKVHYSGTRTVLFVVYGEFINGDKHLCKGK